MIPAGVGDLNLPDGRTLKLRNAGQNAHKLSLETGKGKNRLVLWHRRFFEDYDRLWDFAYFVPVLPGKFIVDLNRDGNPEVGVATWGGGMHEDFCEALVFSLKGNSLRLYGRNRFNIEFGKSIFP